MTDQCGVAMFQGKCQRKDPPCKYLHPPQHLREQLLQNGRNNLILRNLQMQALTTSTSLPPMMPGMYPGMVSTLIPTPTSCDIIHTVKCFPRHEKNLHVFCSRFTRFQFRQSQMVV